MVMKSKDGKFPMHRNLFLLESMTIKNERFLPEMCLWHFFLEKPYENSTEENQQTPASWAVCHFLSFSNSEQ